MFFNASSFPSPVGGAAAFTVLYLPYSLVGPFAGVFIDRWSRRQILVWSAVLRSAFVALTAVLMALGDRGVPLYVAVLLVLGVNRFFLSSLSAALPHVVPEDELVMANSVSPTVGGIMATIGGVVALGLNVATGNTERGAAITLLVGGGCYVAASLIAATMRRDLLGPVREPGQRAAGAAAQRARLGRGRPGGWRALRTQAARSGGGARRDRRLQLPLRAAVPDVDPAVPELFLPVERWRGRGSRRGAAWSSPGSATPARR